MENIKINYYVCATNHHDLWKRREYKRCTAPFWEQVSSEVGKECIKTKKYVTEIFPDNDDYCCTYTFDVKVKKETIITEVYE